MVNPVLDRRANYAEIINQRLACLLFYTNTDTRVSMQYQIKCKRFFEGRLYCLVAAKYEIYTQRRRNLSDFEMGKR